VTEWPWQFDRRVRYLLELTMYEDEGIRFAIEGMDGQLIIALDERLLVVKPGFVREPDFGGLTASIYYEDITRIKIRAGLTNRVIKIHAQDYQLNENHAQHYQGNQVSQAKDFFLSNDRTSIPITRWQLDKYKPHLHILQELVREAREA
jgi:hypothetical protein